MVKRRYSDEDRANALAALAANAGNVNHTARQLGIPAGTLEHWAKSQRHPEAMKMAEQKKQVLADATEDIARRLLCGLTDQKIADMPGEKLLVAYGIAVDKMQLLRGKPTSINHDGLTDAERADRIATLLDAARGRRNGQAAHGGGGAGSG